MPGGGKSCNGVVKTGDLSTDGFITYRRKKRARAVADEFVRGSLDGAHDHDAFSRTGSHWRNSLEYMLHLPGVGEGGGIQSCIQDALESCPPSFTWKTKMDVPVAILQSEDRYEGNCEIEDPPEVKVVLSECFADESNIKLEGQSEVNKNTAKCQKVLLEIFCSDNFASLCDLVGESFHDKTVRKLLDFSLINSKLKNGVYEQVPVSFLEDVQQLWCKFQKIGHDIQLLSTSLSKQSRISYGQLVGEKMELEAGEEKFEQNPHGVAELKNSMSSHVNGQFPLSESGRSNKLDQSEASCLCKVYACKLCGTETLGEHRLICDGCEAIYHFSCVEPSSQVAPSRSWYCSSCLKDESKSPAAVKDNQHKVSHKKWGICDRSEGFMVEENMVNNIEYHCSNKPCQSEASCRYKVYKCKHCSTEALGEHSLICDGCEEIYHFSCVEPFGEEIPTRNWYCASCRVDRSAAPEPVIEIEQDGLHQNCAVCDRLEFSEAEKDITNDTRESSVSNMESDGPREPSRTALAHLCKLCGTCEDEDRRFLTCGNNYCPYKYYHIRCLRNSQIASQHQQSSHCWYCPSCLCRACYLDQDDTEIVLCDGCDDAYHTYCMKPPRTSIPKGQWYCVQCNMARAKEGIRRHEQWILQQHCKKDAFQTTENNRPLDILLNAVEKVSSED
ncbi:PHD finger protein EHD3 isoform X1 [Phalaenopsis equestris]|uniref:PHD finger protein EHD3 isoform X1 n=1 Tax=Phalaenopsis equestris TaxID=78828 RepID=UPI0009E2C2A9|nr:PHD finger protein EHD3 isoform X1 [Phalaenopsis equestris]XP_020574868.1 PHD finger protein EHD3 isoform X1 [Phalaenopsis equestris]XP_020574869.1 PHD finger protein EHD3 isoform X1 [Phalaenopsis equestris]